MPDVFEDEGKKWEIRFRTLFRRTSTVTMLYVASLCTHYHNTGDPSPSKLGDNDENTSKRVILSGTNGTGGNPTFLEFGPVQTDFRRIRLPRYKPFTFLEYTERLGKMGMTIGR